MAKADNGFAVWDFKIVALAHTVGGAKGLSLLTSPLAKVGWIQSLRAVSVCLMCASRVLVAVPIVKDSRETVAFVRMYVCVSRC